MRVGKMFLPKEFHINVKGMKRTGNFPEVFPSSDCCGEIHGGMAESVY